MLWNFRRGRQGIWRRSGRFQQAWWCGSWFPLCCCCQMLWTAAKEILHLCSFGWTSGPCLIYDAGAKNNESLKSTRRWRNKGSFATRTKILWQICCNYKFHKKIAIQNLKTGFMKRRFYLYSFKFLLLLLLWQQCDYTLQDCYFHLQKLFFIQSLLIVWTMLFVMFGYGTWLLSKYCSPTQYFSCTSGTCT